MQSIVECIVEDIKTARSYPSVFAVSIPLDFWMDKVSGMYIKDKKRKVYASQEAACIKEKSSRPAVGRRKLGLLCWASDSCMRWWKFGQIIFVSSSSGSHDGVYFTLIRSSIELVSLLSLPSLLRLAQAGQAQ
eukprot:275652-Pelagomonas_calceolata.AAC.1